MTRLVYDDARLQEFLAWALELCPAGGPPQLPDGYPVRLMIQSICDVAVPQLVAEIRRLRAAREADRSTVLRVADALDALDRLPASVGGEERKAAHSDLADALAAWRAARADVDAMRPAMPEGETTG